MLRRRSVQQPCQKEFGALVSIHKPDLISPSSSDSDEDTVELRYDVPPELPCHVPTPETINQVRGLGGFLKRDFSQDSHDTTLSSKERRRQKLLKKAPTTASDDSVYACGKLQILITSPVSTKWGPDIWNSLKTNNGKKSRKGLFSSSKRETIDSAVDGDDTASTPRQRRRKQTKGNHKIPKSPSSPVGKSSGAETGYPQTPPKINSKLVLSETTVETVFVAPTVSSNKKNKTSSYTNNNNKILLASPLQRKWMQENALNLNSSCQEDCDDEVRVSSRRSRFLRMTAPTI